MTKASVPLSKMKAYTKSNEPVEMLTSDRMDRMRVDRLKSWVTMYRNNIHIFVEHYMGINLFPYQRVAIWLMSHSTRFLGIWSRASAKSWLVGVYSIAKCILYPGTTVALASSTKAQAGLIISEKCQMLHDESPNIQRETISITTNQNKWAMAFKNGSKINVVVSGEGGRGHRSNVTVLEERRLIPNAIIDSVIRPFLVSRTPPFLKLPEYAEEAHKYREEPVEIVISSAYYKAHEWWAEAKNWIRKMVAGDKDTRGLFFDYLISIRHGIKTKKQMLREKEDFDPISFLMEYGNIPYGSSAKSFYKLGMFRRIVRRSWRPITTEDYVAKIKNIYDIPKTPDELRLVSVDVATRAGKSNDNTIIICARLLPGKRGWLTEITYIESHHGANTVLQALRVKQIFEEFEGDVLVLDIANAGISLYDSLVSLTKDEERNVEYPAYTVMLDEEIDDNMYEDLKNRTLSKDAIECVFPIYTSASLNSYIAVKFRERLKKRLVKFLVDDNAEEEFLIKSGDKNIISQDEIEKRAYLLQANVQTSLLINECIALDMDIIGGNIRLTEPEGARKDRYTACSYLNYYVSLLDVELLKDASGLNDEEEVLGVTVVI